GLQNFQLGKLFPLLNGIVETSLIDQFHDKIELTMVAAEGVNFDDVRMIDRRGDARLLLQLRGVIRFGIAPQKFQGDESIESGVSRFVNRTHPTDTQRLDKNETVERAFDPKFLTTLRTRNAREWFDVSGVDLRPATRAGLHLRRILAVGHHAIV